MRVGIPLSRVGGDEPNQAAAAQEAYRRELMQRRFRRLLAVPPPAREPTPEDFPKAEGDGYERD